jgi:hypothetical protein
MGAGMETGLSKLARSGAVKSVTLSLSKCDNNFASLWSRACPDHGLPAVRGVLHLGLFAILLSVTLLASPAMSATINVTANAPDVLNGANGVCSLREAITNINNGATTYADCANTGAAYGTSDTINIPAGTYTTAIAGAGEDLNATGDYDITSNIAITGAGAGSTIINGGAIDRVFYITGAFTVSFSGVTITGGNLGGTGGGGNVGGAGGGGMLNNGGTVTITNSTISGNSVALGSGGGIVNLLGTLTITGSTINGNSASYSGGGILNWLGGTLTVTNSTVNGNTAANYGHGGGGAGIANGGTLTVSNSTISSNTSANYGGGILNLGTLNVNNSTTISNNTALEGGGIWNNYTLTIKQVDNINATYTGLGRFTISNSIINNNTATGPGGPGGSGGGIANGGTLDITTSTISNNTASGWGAYGGGGIWNNGVGALTLTNSTISANSSTGRNGGGGIGNYGPNGASSGTVTVIGSNIINNTADGNGGGGIGNLGTLTVANSTISGNQVNGLAFCDTPSAPCVPTGGGIANEGTITVTNSTISGNQVTVANSAGGGGGGGIANSGAITFANSTISGNTASGAGSDGGGIINVGTISVTNSTISGNTAPSAGGLYSGRMSTRWGIRTGAVNLSNSIVANQTSGADCVTDTYGKIFTSGHNLESGTSCGFTGTGDKQSANPLLGALASNGGPTQTMALGGGSPAIDAGSCVQAIDQRGYIRPSSACDIGAYEVGATAGIVVSARAGFGGMVTPMVTGVVSGSTASFMAAPNPGYTTSASVGGDCAAGSWAGTTYTTGAVTAACSVSFIFTPATGSLTVTISPAEAITAGAFWSVDGGASWQASGATVTWYVAGAHTVTFNNVSGYKSPANKTVAIALGKTTAVTGAYTAASGSGSLKVTISPAGAVTAGAKWSVDGGTTWNDSGYTATGVSAGSHTVSFKTVTGYTSPADKVVNITNLGKATATGTYKQDGSLIVTILPAGLAGAKWSVDGGTTWNDSAFELTGLTAGSYTLSFNTAVADYSPPADKTVRVNSGLPTKVTGTYTTGYTVSAEESTGGTVTPAKKTVTGGSTVTFTVKARTGYITNPTVGGTCSAGSWNGTAYTTGAVAQACTVDFTFTKKPTITPGSATNITQNGATLNGKVNPENASATVTFEYVKDATYVENIYGANVSAGVLTGGTSQAVAVAVTGLTCGTTYHFRVVAVNVVNTTNGRDRTFKTSKCAAADSNKTKTPVSDFDGDGKSDILLRDGVSGQTAVWMMNGSQVSSNLATSLNAGAYTSTTGWQAHGIGDFDGDGKNDVLWRDAVTGELAVWTMNGATVVTSATASVNPGAYTSTAGWHVQGIGDFDGDGKSDILWRDSATGQTAIWFMNGAVVTSSSKTSVSAGAYTPTTGWHVNGVGDFNGDGKADILWRRAGTGKTAIWFMNGASKTGGGYTNVQPGAYTSTTGWQVQAVGDFNGDGKADILLRSSETGRMAIWKMNGVKVTSSAYTSVDAGGLQVSAIADYNGDGKADILLRDVETGQTRVWVMNGSQVTSDVATDVNPGAYTPSTGWSVVSEKAVR